MPVSKRVYLDRMPKPMISLQTTPETDAALNQLTHNGQLNRSDVIRDAILRAARKPTSRSLSGIDLPTAKKTSHALLDLLSMVVTGLEEEDPESALELVSIVESRMRYWRMDRQDHEERMTTALNHVKAVLEEVPPKRRPAVMADAVERLREQVA